MSDRLWALRETGHVERAHCVPHHGGYSLAAHQWQVVTLILLLHPRPSRELIIAAHFHDAPERWTGDVPGPAKWMDGDDLEAALTRVEQRARDECGLSISLTDAEAEWLKVCDRLELLLWCYDQQQLGNLHVRPMMLLLEDAFRSNWDMLPAEIRTFLGDERFSCAKLWRRTPDTGFWRDQVNDNLLPGRGE